jgi:hypothetical protein
MIQADQHIVYSEKQKLDLKKWILVPLGIAVIAVILIVLVPGLYFYFTQGNAFIAETFNAANMPKGIIIVLGGLIPLLLIYVVRRKMKLELFITQQGLKYDYSIFNLQSKFLSWDQVTAIHVKKYPYQATRPGKQYVYGKSGYEAYVMTADLVGLEMTLKNGQARFFTSTEPDEFIKAIRKLELDIQIQK